MEELKVILSNPLVPLDAVRRAKIWGKHLEFSAPRWDAGTSEHGVLLQVWAAL